MLSPRFQTTRCPDMAQDPVRPRDTISSADSKRAQSGASLQAGDIPHTATEEPAQSKVSLLVVAMMALVPSFLRAQSWSLLGYAEADRRAFAISRATFSPFKTLEQLPSLALSQESDRKEVAKILLKKIPEEVFISLRRIGIQDKEFTFEVAHAAVNSSVTSLYYPWWRSNKKLPERVGQLNLSDEERFAILATVLDRRSHELPVYGRTLRPALPEIRFKFACMWAESKAEIQSIGGSPEALFPLSKAWLPDEHMPCEEQESQCQTRSTVLKPLENSIKPTLRPCSGLSSFYTLRVYKHLRGSGNPAAASTPPAMDVAPMPRS